MRKISFLLFSTTLISSIIVSTSVYGVEQSITSKGSVSFKENVGPTDPVNPENPDPENPIIPTDPTDPDIDIDIPGNPGPLSLDFASYLYFGEQSITSKTKTYKAAAQSYKNSDGTNQLVSTTNYVQVTDTRGVANDTWTLSVKQEGQFVSGNKELIGAEINFTKANLNSLSLVESGETTPVLLFDTFALVPDEEQVLVNANEGQGAGTWVLRFGEDATLTNVTEADGSYAPATDKLNGEITLVVPGSTDKLKQTYATTLIWTLKDVPSIEI